MESALSVLWGDLRLAGRRLAGQPAWTAAAVVCLAIATGASTAAFTIVNGLLLRPLPFDESERLVVVALRAPETGGPRPFSLMEYRALAARSSPDVELLARTFHPVSLAADDGAQMVQAEAVSGNYFQVLRLRPLLGAFFTAGSDRPGAEPTAVLSYRLWRGRFSGDPSIVGRTVRVNGQPVVVSGIAPEGFVGAMQLVAADLWLPASLHATLSSAPDADATPGFGLFGRLADDVTVERAEAQLSWLEADVSRAPSTSTTPRVIVRPARGFGVPPALQGTILTLSGVLYGLLALLMAIACANVASLVLARGVGRTREFAIALSLGASRWQVARPLIADSLALAAMGAVVGGFVAVWATQALSAHLVTPFPHLTYVFDVQPDYRVFGYSVGVTALAAVLCGLAPIRHALRTSVLDVLQSSAARGRSARSHRSLSAIVTLQFAVSTTLLVGAGLLVSHLLTSERDRPAFSTEGLVAATVDAGPLRLTRPQLTSLIEELLGRVTALRPVAGPALASDLLPGQGQRLNAFVATRGATGQADQPIAVSRAVVSSTYFRTVGLALRQGRVFSDSEPSQSGVAVISETMAARLWPNASPLGRTLRLDRSDADPIEVVGVVADATREPAGASSNVQVYVPFHHSPVSRLLVVARFDGAERALLADVRRAAMDVHRDLTIADLATVDEMLDRSAAAQRAPTAALAGIGLVGLLLSAVGLYGVVSYVVRHRSPELGIRLALGARPRDIGRLVLWQGLGLVAIGVAAGLAGALAIGRAADSVVFGLSASAPMVMGLVIGVLTAAALAALHYPVRYAMRLDPARILRGN
jgi:predicted permease